MSIAALTRLGSAGGDAGGAASTSRARGPLTTFTTTAHQQEAFIEALVKAIITANVPFTFIENEHLQTAASIVGVCLPSRKVVAGPLLDRIFDGSQDESLDTLQARAS